MALGDFTQGQLAAKHGVNQPAISKFAKRHAHEIAELSEKLAEAADDEFVGLWSVEKANRIAMYEQVIDDIGNSKNPSLLRHKLAALKAIAEEMGQLPARHMLHIDGGGGGIKFVVEGVDTDKLK